nr:malonate decarboxylase, epsilon subunit [Klebsiella pneumoniae]
MLWDPQRIADDLAMNMARPVHWQEAMVAADERDARLAIEMPPAGTHLPDPPAGWRGETIALERSGSDVARHLAQRLSD